MHHRLWVCMLAGLLGIVGCRTADVDEGLLTTAGNVKVDGEAAPNATVTFIPQGNTAGHGGTGTTDATGHYQLTSPYGKTGLPPGEYKVTVSRRLNRDGSPPDPKEMPIESQARETLPTKYSDKDKTELRVTLTADEKRSFDFDLKVKKK
ncbi:MAG: carboxypeptidase regulatory-like domain-containing protein [Planctomycetes bacterium]|nr:carboxypeptidase regulatory-like domain-containing protein [Planctomycetota bacterium]